MNYRGISRAVAIVDMIFAAFSTLGVLVLIVLFAFVTGPLSRIVQEKVPNTTGADGETGDKTVAAVDTGFAFALAWIVIIVTGICCLLQIFAAWRLINGTEETVTAADGLRHCRIWRGITIFFIVLIFISAICRFTSAHLGMGFLNLIVCVLHIFALFFVQRYMNDLTLALPTALTGNQPGAQYYPDTGRVTKK